MTIAPFSNEGWLFADDALACPICGENFLHQGDVEVFNRAEDEQTRAVRIPTKSGPIIGTPGDNPSGRRQGLYIEFTCESCHFDQKRAPFRLAIYQHKGQTFFDWRFAE